MESEQKRSFLSKIIVDRANFMVLMGVTRGWWAPNVSKMADRSPERPAHTQTKPDRLKTLKLTLPKKKYEKEQEDQYANDND